ncbi:MAG: ATP-binding cassette domain-containing protein [Oscillospiraceae bacterium]|nr:ATP-binding cassette domain-containing protein [Oscillospiraceae bacterium]
MLLLQANNIVKRYGERTVLSFSSLCVYEGDKIGIVGANGAGKSTLLSVLSGEIPPEEGTVVRRISPVFLRQMQTDVGIGTPLSGGEAQKRRILNQTCDRNAVLFADEPTANLDTEGIAWVQRKLREAATVLLVSHDRDLLDSVCTRIVEVEDGALTEYTGTYTDFLAAKEEKRKAQIVARKTYQTQKAQLEDAIRTKERKVARQRQKKKREYANNLSEARLGGHKRKASMKKQEQQAKVLAGRLERLEVADAPKERPRMHIDFSLTNPPESPFVIRCEGLNFSYENKRIFRNASFQIRRNEKVAVCGFNGCGKSTLFSLLERGHPAITRVPKLRLGVLCQDFSQLDLGKTVLENAMSRSVQSREVVRAALAALLFRGEDVHKRAVVLSGGEKMRLALGMLMLSDVNCLLLDEPTNYLDIPSLEAVEEAVKAYPGTVLFVAHDSRFVEAIADRTLILQDGTIGEGRADTEQKRPHDRLVLEMRRVEILSKIGAAKPDEKEKLELEYRRITEQLQAL